MITNKMQKTTLNTNKVGIRKGRNELTEEQK